MKTKQVKADDLDARERLLRAAAQICAQRGIRGASVRKICELAGVNMAMVNYYFGSKDELYIAVIKRASVHGFVESHLATVRGDASASERLKQMIEYMLVTLLSKGPESETAKLVSWELADPTPALSYIVETLLRPMNDSFRSLVHEISPISLTDEQARLHVFGIIGQILLLGHSRPVVELLAPNLHYDDTGIRAMAAHIAFVAIRGLGAETVAP